MDADTRAAILAAWERRPESRPPGDITLLPPPLPGMEPAWSWFGYYLSDGGVLSIAIPAFIRWLEDRGWRIKDEWFQGRWSLRLTNGRVLRRYFEKSRNIALARAVYAEGE